MNAMTVLELTNRKKARNLVRAAMVPLKGISDIALQTIGAIRIERNEITSRNATRYRIGDVVHHAQFGLGHVRAIWPDGRLQIRFEAKGRNHLIFPSLVNTIS